MKISNLNIYFNPYKRYTNITAYLLPSIFLLKKKKKKAKLVYSYKVYI